MRLFNAITGRKSSEAPKVSTKKTRRPNRVAPNLVQVRVTKDEKRQLAKWAKENGMSVSDVIRELIKRLK